MNDLQNTIDSLKEKAKALSIHGMTEVKFTIFAPLKQMEELRLAVDPIREGKVWACIMNATTQKEDGYSLSIFVKSIENYIVEIKEIK